MEINWNIKIIKLLSIAYALKDIFPAEGHGL